MRGKDVKHDVITLAELAGTYHAWRGTNAVSARPGALTEAMMCAPASVVS
jgi:hypothetical protein